MRCLSLQLFSCFLKIYCRTHSLGHTSTSECLRIRITAIFTIRAIEHLSEPVETTLNDQVVNSKCIAIGIVPCISFWNIFFNKPHYTE